MHVARWKRFLWNSLIVVFLPAFLLAAVLPAGRRKQLVWGTEPGHYNRNCSLAMRQAGWDSITIMTNHYAITSPDEFDSYFTDFAKLPLPQSARWAIGSCLAFIYALRRARCVHISFWGFSLGLSAFWRLEHFFFRIAGIKVITICFGGDVYMYSKIADPSLRYGLLASYPDLARYEGQTEDRIRYWTTRANCMLFGYMIDGIGRWDVTVNSVFTVDTDMFTPRGSVSAHDGTTGPVRIMHAPNHREFKGTEFIIDAVERLKGEGLNVELLLIERIPHSEIPAIMQRADILVEQIIMTHYAINAMEGMASGLPVLSNMENEFYTRVFRRYSFLDECPVLSTSPETLLDNLRLLVRNPELRGILGAAGRKYVEKYHSFEMSRYLFGSIYAKVLDGQDIDLMKLFHPLSSPFNARLPRIEHPLVESKLPAEWRNRNV
jgi:hypothetical protein